MMSPDQANGFYSRTFQLGIGKLHLKVPRVRTALDFDGHKPVLGYWVNEGGENRGFWSDVFQDLISRGLKRVLMFVTDDFSVVKELIEKLYPLA
ncbi:MAG: transposase, partial [Nitrososphaerota archaeon]|nr:transposase [Nitrososphaerota archaeon]